MIENISGEVDDPKIMGGIAGLDLLNTIEEPISAYLESLSCLPFVDTGLINPSKDITAVSHHLSFSAP